MCRLEGTTFWHDIMTPFYRPSYWVYKKICKFCLHNRTKLNFIYNFTISLALSISPSFSLSQELSSCISSKSTFSVWLRPMGFFQNWHATRVKCLLLYATPLRQYNNISPIKTSKYSQPFRTYISCYKIFSIPTLWDHRYSQENWRMAEHSGKQYQKRFILNNGGTHALIIWFRNLYSRLTYANYVLTETAKQTKEDPHLQWIRM